MDSNVNIKKDILQRIYSAITSLFNQGQIAKSTALAKSLVIKAGPGTLYKLVVYNGNAGAQYIQLHDSATLPSDNAVPVAVFQAGAGATIDFPIHNIKGLDFKNGIVVCNSSTAAIKTLGGAADCWFHAIFV